MGFSGTRVLSKGITLEPVLGELPSKNLFSFQPRCCTSGHEGPAWPKLPAQLESEVVILRAFFSKHSTGQTSQRFLCPQLASETELAGS